MERPDLTALRALCQRFVQCYDPAGTARYIRSHCPDEAAGLLRQADQLLAHTFRFQDKWDMEPCPTPYTLEPGQWLYSPNGDPEWVFMLNRHDLLLKLWQAAQLTGEERYLASLRDYLLDWAERNPITLAGTDATRTIDTGIRCMNWCGLLLPLLARNVLDDGQAGRLLDCMARQFENMRARYIGKYTLSNWGVLQTTAICAGYAWFGDFLPDGLEAWAWDELEQELELQILEDGAHWEQSAMYHVEVLNTCVKLLAHLLYAQAAGQPLCSRARRALAGAHLWTDAEEAAAAPGQGYDRGQPGWLWGAVRVLSRHVLYTADPAHLQLPQCDSDVTDVRDVLARSAALLDGGGIYRFAAGSRLDMDSAWLLGAPGRQRFLDRAPCVPGHLQWDCGHAGNFFWRSSWEEDADFTWLKNSTLGSGHGHLDQTQLCLYHKGRPFLVDSGRYTYREDDPLRMALKNPQAHSVCVIDGQSGGHADSSWTNDACGEVLKSYACTRGAASYAEMPLRGTLADGTPYLIVRKVLVLPGGVWLSVQDVSCAGAHVLEESFHLDEAVQAAGKDRTFTLQNGGVRLNLFSDAPLTLGTAVHSKRYNEKTDAPVLRKRGVMDGRQTWAALLTAEGIEASCAPVFQFGKPQPVSPDCLTAWDLRMPDGTTWTALLWHRETFRGGKMYLCHDIPVYGKAVVLHRDADGALLERIRLKT